MYDLDIEIVEVTGGCWKVVAKVRLKLKNGWTAVKKTAPPVYLAVVTAMGGLAYYEDVRAGAILAFQDANHGYESVFNNRQQNTKPGVFKGGSCTYIPPDNQKPSGGGSSEWGGKDA